MPYTQRLRDTNTHSCPRRRKALHRLANMPTGGAGDNDPPLNQKHSQP
jgi:hypothetical protein